MKVLLPRELMSLFAKPDIGENYTIWTSDEFLGGAVVKSFSVLDESEKNLIAAEIEDKKEQILALLSNSPLLSPFSDNLFLIAEEDDIKVITDGTRSTVVLCRWGSKSNVFKTAINPLSVVINRPGNNRSDVSLFVKYLDGDYASAINTSVEYKGGIKTYQTDEYGKAHLGRFLHGSNLKIYFNFGNEKRYQKQIVIDEKTLYEINLPKTGDALITVVNQDNKSIPKADIEVLYQNNRTGYKTNENGTLILENLEYGEKLQIFASFLSETGSISSNADLLISNPENELTIGTIDQNDKPFSTNLSISSFGKINEYSTDENGSLYLNGLYEIGQNFSIKVKEFNYELNDYKIIEKENEIIIKLSVPEPKMISVKLLDFKKQLLPGTLIDFSSKNISESRTTNDASLCTFNQGDFIHNEKIKARIHYPKKKKNGDVKTVFYSKSFSYDENRHEYILQLRRRNWWWLLLLLIPLLLIQCEKEIPVKVLNSKTNAVIQNASVSMHYCKQNLFRPWRLFAFDVIDFQEKTDGKGSCTFKKVRYSVYSLIFFNFTKAHFSASKICNHSAVTHYLYYLPDTVYIKLENSNIKLDFVVVDKETQEPLDSALVFIEYEDGNNQKNLEKQITDNDGKINVELSNCAEKIRVIGSKRGYINDEIIKSKISDLEGNLDENRKLELEKTKNPIPCNSVINSGGAGVTTDEYYVGDIESFILDYDFYSVRDKIIIYCGKNKKDVLLNTGFTSGRRQIKIDLSKCKSDWITIEVTGPNGTDWRYNVICP
jgi:hypothetical protein